MFFARTETVAIATGIIEKLCYEIDNGDCILDTVWEWKNRRKQMKSMLELLTGRKDLETIQDVIDDIVHTPKNDREGVFDRDDKTDEFLGFAGCYKNPNDLQVVDDILAFSFKGDELPTPLVEEYVLRLLETHREVWWSAHRPNKRVVDAYTKFVYHLRNDDYQAEADVAVKDIQESRLRKRAKKFNLVYFYVKAKNYEEETI
jgi:hypothetical protein